jgi:hypothetical protein
MVLLMQVLDYAINLRTQSCPGKEIARPCEITLTEALFSHTEQNPLLIFCTCYRPSGSGNINQYGIVSTDVAQSTQFIHNNLIFNLGS